MLAFAAAVTTALIVSFMCSIFESVLLSVGHAQIEALTNDGKRAGRLLRRFKQRIDVPIAAILIVNTVAHTVGAAVAGATYENVFDPGTLWIFTIVFTLAVLLFTEIVPKTFGVTHTQALAAPVAYGIYALTVALKPLVAVSERISRALRGGKQPPITSIEEIRLLASLGRSEGIVGPRTADIIVRATDLAKLRAADVLLPRAMVTFLSATSSNAEVVETIRTSGYSRFPFSPTDTVDDVTGVVLAKDLLLVLVAAPDAPIDWNRLVREPLVVPGTRRLNTLTRAFQEARSHMALVVDEYGDFEGILTLEDVLEEIVGDIEDEADAPSDDIVRQPDGSLSVAGTAELRRVWQVLGAPSPTPASAVTVGGLVTEQLGRVPVAGDAVDWNGCRFEVLTANRRRAELVAVRALPQAAAP